MTQIKSSNGGGRNRVSKADWLQGALELLRTAGVEAVRVERLASALGVAKSGFYYHFRDRSDLHDALLDHWERTNTAALVSMAERPAKTITESVGNVFKCAINPDLFDTQLDFAIRDWARRSPRVRETMQRSDAQRLDALTRMFQRFDYPKLEAVARARILYYMQIGYDDARLGEPMSARNALMPAYLVGFTGQHPSDEEVATPRAYTQGLASHQIQAVSD